MIENKKSCCYGYGKPETQTLIKLVKITGIQNVYTEIICAKNTSGLCQEMQESNGRYGLYQEQVSDIYIQIFCGSTVWQSTMKAF